MRKSIIYCLLFTLGALELFSQASTDMMMSDYRLRDGFGVFGNYNFNRHAADFRELPGVPTCCPVFGSGNGNGVSAGLLYQLPLSQDFFLNTRLGYFNHDGTLTSIESTPQTMVVNENGDAVQGRFEHKIVASIASIAFEPMIGYRLWKDLSIMAGFHAGYNITRDYTQSERLIEPSTGTYIDSTRNWLPSSGQLPDGMKYDLAVIGGVSYDLPLTASKTWMLSPEAFYSFSLLPVIDNVNFKKDWKIHTIRAGVALKYLPYSYASANYTGSGRPPEPSLMADVQAYGLGEDMIEKPVAQVHVEEFLSTQIKPLLTYVFFGDNSSDIPDRYRTLTKEEAASFTIDQLKHKGVLETYYNLLNIIGRRMLDRPDAKIAIDGCNSDAGDEKGNLGLSRRRAQVVKDYLVNTWGIEPGRIIMSERNLPQDPSHVDDPDGITENRRVEISANDFEIIAPIIIDDTLRAVNPPVVRFRNKYMGDKGVDQWALAATYKGNNLAKFDGKETVPDVVDWRFADNELSIPRNDAFDYQFVVKDKDGQTYQTPVKNLPVEQVTIQTKRRNKVADKYVDRYSLILFQFDKSHLGVYNQKIVDLIKGRAKPTSTYNVIGYTDRMGNEEHNQKLSLDRAKTVGEALGVNDTNVKGVGEKEIIYDNDLPEGRFYSRKVDVIVETPIEE